LAHYLLNHLFLPQFALLILQSPLFILINLIITQNYHANPHFQIYLILQLRSVFK